MSGHFCTPVYDFKNSLEWKLATVVCGELCEVTGVYALEDSRKKSRALSIISVTRRTGVDEFRRGWLEIAHSFLRRSDER
ncbi:MAG: hypothetical protein HKN18_02940 [Silicimonas sp.]|nr:hypothetical protein [Silicimonas sp.]